MPHILSLVCAKCHTPFTRKAKDVKNPERVFCSHRCAGSNPRFSPGVLIVYLTCFQCQRLFVRRAKSVTQDAAHTVCSNTCRDNMRRTVPSFVSCETCTKLFKPDTSNYKRWSHHYCSTVCRDNGTKERTILHPWQPSPEIAAYVAGFVDGDGSISVNRSHRGQVDVRLANTHLPSIEWMQQQFSGISYLGKRSGKQANHATMYDLSMCSGYAVSFLQGITPYLLVKQHEAQQAIAFQKTAMTTKERRSFQLVRRIACTAQAPCPLAEMSPSVLLPYIAGFFDAEGCINYLPSYKRLTISFVNIHWCIIHWLAHHAGIHGAISSRPGAQSHHHAIHRWTLLGVHAMTLAQRLLPYLHVKQEQVEEKVPAWLALTRLSNAGHSETPLLLS